MYIYVFHIVFYNYDSLGGNEITDVGVKNLFLVLKLNIALKCLK